ncbi:MAG: ABC transporter permease [Clostridiales bacterium]|nr:ABC transporter permease [Clostridiales bacterium]
MNIVEAFLISFQAIWSNKLRSILTMLGLIIGISSVVTIVSLGNATQITIEEELSSLGVNSVFIYYEKSAIIKPSEKFIFNDMSYIEENFIESVLFVTPNISRPGEIISDIYDTGLTFNASTTDTDESEDLTLIDGRFLNDFDISGYKKNIVIDSDIAVELFDDTKISGNKILVKTGNISNSYNIVGVYQKEESIGGFSSAAAYLPYTTMDMIYKLNGQMDGIKITFNSTVENPDLEKERIITAIERRKNNLGEEKYSTFSAEDLIETVSTTLGMITLFISAIAAISLIVGGIGVMNIMLVSVTERTREIGIRKALGAQYSDIMIQFLIEAVTISIIGGFIGSIFGGIFTSVGGKLMDINAVVSVDSLILAILFSTSIGIFFGIYPANKAAKLDPIEALRHE